MSNYASIMKSPALNTLHISQNANYGVHGMALGVRKVNNAADDKVRQPAFTLSGYPELWTGGGSTATARATTKYNYDAIVTSEQG